MTSLHHPLSVRRLAPAIVVVAALGLAACSSSDEPQRRAAAQREPSTASATPTTPPPPPEPSVLSGRMDRPNQPVMVAKVDNTREAHPQVGLTKADVIYIEQVEGGVTRLAAVFSSRYPTFVGPVRSARITDIALLRQYGKVGLFYSGAQPKLQDNLRRADLGLVSFDDNRSGYRRAAGRPMPYDVIGTFDRLVERAGKTDAPADVGYEFGDPPLGGTPAKAFTASFPGARVSGSWSGNRWLLSMDGMPARAAEGGRLGATTFVVQFSEITGSNYYDINGAQTPMTLTVGQGKAMFFRDGQVYEGQWSRSGPRQPTEYTIGGRRAVFAPGQIWVALLGKGRPVDVS